MIYQNVLRSATTIKTRNSSKFLSSHNEIIFQIFRYKYQITSFTNHHGCIFTQIGGFPVLLTGLRTVVQRSGDIFVFFNELTQQKLTKEVRFPLGQEHCSGTHISCPTTFSHTSDFFFQTKKQTNFGNCGDLQG